MDTKQEFSAGGVVYKQVNNSFVFLLGKHSGYHKWVLPKGLIEEGETPEETAVRETEEEMAVTGKIVRAEPIHIEHYWYMAALKTSPSPNIQKSKQNSKEDTATRRVESYQEDGGTGTRINKTVTFFLMQYQSGEPEEHGWEMEDAGWFTYKEALKIMSFQGEKRALEIAYKLLTTA